MEPYLSFAPLVTLIGVYPRALSQFWWAAIMSTKTDLKRIVGDIV